MSMLRKFSPWLICVLAGSILFAGITGYTELLRIRREMHQISKVSKSVLSRISVPEERTSFALLSSSEDLRRKIAAEEILSHGGNNNDKDIQLKTRLVEMHSHRLEYARRMNEDVILNESSENYLPNHFLFRLPINRHHQRACARN